MKNTPNVAADCQENRQNRLQLYLLLPKRYHPIKAVPKTAVRKTAVNWPIIEFGGFKGFFFYWRPFQRPFWEAAFLARNPCLPKHVAPILVTEIFTRLAKEFATCFYKSRHCARTCFSFIQQKDKSLQQHSAVKNAQKWLQSILSSCDLSLFFLRENFQKLESCLHSLCLYVSLSTPALRKGRSRLIH